MPMHLDRMKEEYRDLFQRRNVLLRELPTLAITLDDEEAGLLKQQLKAMDSYCAALGTRIGRAERRAYIPPGTLYNLTEFDPPVTVKDGETMVIDPSGAVFVGGKRVSTAKIKAPT